jgi:hypothetical protein
MIGSGQMCRSGHQCCYADRPAPFFVNAACSSPFKAFARRSDRRAENAQTHRMQKRLLRMKRGLNQERARPCRIVKFIAAQQSTELTMLESHMSSARPRPYPARVNPPSEKVVTL